MSARITKQGRDWLAPRQPLRWQDDTYVRTWRSPRAWAKEAAVVALLPVFVVVAYLFLEAVR